MRAYGKKIPKCKCGQPLFWYEVEGSVCFDCKSKITGIDKHILLQDVRQE